MARKKKGVISRTIARGASGLLKLFGEETQQIHDIQSGADGNLWAALSDLSSWTEALSDEDDKNRLLPKLPADRLLRYIEFDKMEDDPICGQALQFHVDNALTYDEDAGNSVYIESRSDENDPIVADLRNVFHEWQQEHSKKILFNVAKYGCWGVRPYFHMKGDNYLGMDMEHTEVSPEGHPQTWRQFFSRGKYAGVWSEFQHPNHQPRLSEPWRFVIFKSPAYSTRTGTRIRRVHPTDPGHIHDIWDDQPPVTLSENPDYGQSLFTRAYTFWKGLEEACLALLIARLKSAQRETIVAYPLSNQDPLEASRMIRQLTETMQNREDEDAKRTLREGLVRISKKLILPYAADGKGQVNFAQTEANINIEGIQDVMLTVKILCGALGIDPSLVGFSDMMAGGLGEGGWFRVSLQALAYGTALRQALRNGYEDMYGIHVYLRWGKKFTPDNKPWRTKFNASSSGKELEMGSVRLQRMDFAERLGALVSTLMEGGEEGGGPGKAKQVLLNVLLTNTLKMEEPIVKELTNLNGKPDEQTEEKGEKFFGMKQEDQKKFVEEQVNTFWGNNF